MRPARLLARTAPVAPVGVPLNCRAALAAYERAARGRDVHAFNEGGVLHAKGGGVPIDSIKAAAWFMVSASRGDATPRGYFKTVGG